MDMFLPLVVKVLECLHLMRSQAPDRLKCESKVKTMKE